LGGLPIKCKQNSSSTRLQSSVVLAWTAVHIRKWYRSNVEVLKVLFHYVISCTWAITSACFSIASLCFINETDINSYKLLLRNVLISSEELMVSAQCYFKNGCSVWPWSDTTKQLSP
jgi:hypothetical protein